MPQKSEEEIYKYVLDYKNKHLGQFNDGAESLYHRANDIDIKLGSDLIVLASAGIALVGAIVASQSLGSSGILKFALAFSVFALFISIGGGLRYYTDVQKFWKAWGDLKHEQAGMIYNDSSKTVEDLDILLQKIKDKGNEVPEKSDIKARQVQVYAFIVGVATLCLVIFGTLANNSSIPVHKTLNNHRLFYHLGKKS